MLKKLLPLAFFVLSISVCAQTGSSTLGNQKSVSGILNKDGSLQAGVNGSYNAKGYNLTFGKHNEPILTKTMPGSNSTVVTWSAVTGGGINGVSGSVEAIAISGSDVYVGGDFTTLGDSTTTANRIAKWDGTSWSPLTGGGINGVSTSLFDAVDAIAVSGSDVYVGGAFLTLGDGTTAANNIAKWDGTSWSAVTGSGINGVNGKVYAIAVSGSDVYVGGQFTTLGDGTTAANNVAKWDGTSWSAVTGGGLNGVSDVVDAIAVSGSDVYVGGYFTTLGDGTTAANGIAKWDGTSWLALTGAGTNGVSGYVYAIAISGSNVYAGGDFTTLGDGTTAANHIAKWDGTSWSAVTGAGINGVSNSVSAIAVSGSDVYVGGAFLTLGDGITAANGIAKWDGTSWSALTDGSYPGVYKTYGGTITALSVSTSEGKMYVGGNFSRVGASTTVNNIAKFTDPDNPLPVELASFSASVNENVVTLKWQTATELNNHGFEIERTNQNSKVKIGRI